MYQDYKLKEILKAFDPIADWQPKGMRELAKRVRWEEGWQGVGPLSCRSLMRTLDSNSLLQTLRAIDSNNPPRSLLQAFEKLGFPVGGGVTLLPNHPISLLSIAKRVNVRDDARQIRFLSYNTYLLPGLRLPLGTWIDEIYSWDALKWFDIPFDDTLLALLGIPIPPIRTVALGTVLKALGLTPSKIVKTLLDIDLNDIVHIQEKPALNERTQSLGPILGIYDVCCLCEIFTQQTIETILARLGYTSNGASFASTAGPDRSGAWTMEGSGLFFIARTKYPIVKTERLVFANRGDKQKDSDAWANKGALLNVIDLGFGRMELYQTHLYYGDDLPEFSIPGLGIQILSIPSEEERMAVRRAELQELSAFYQLHHDPKNVAIITGDFNTNGANVREYADVRHAMDSLNLHDVWAWDVYSHNPSEGHTCRFTDKEPHETDFNAGCSVTLEQGSLQNPWRPFCDDTYFHKKPQKGVGRMDFVFIERPTALHSYRLEAARILRRTFPLASEIYDEGEIVKFQSDHLGLELTLYLSPR